MELTLVGLSVETLFPEAAEDFSDVLLMVGRVVRVDEDVIEVDNHVDVEQVLEDVVHKTLEGYGSIDKSKRHDEPFKGSVLGPEGRFPFITFVDTYEVVHMPEVDLGVDASLLHSVEEVRDERERIPILPGNFVETPVVHT